ncbi:hypothetical protein BGZ58_007009 [Dissophora ornata]|nr:hypothetical protein BGZ58_007009 [Dissophora ornata]
MFKHIHCNKCFKTEPIPEARYLITECGHVLCQSCIDRATGNQDDKRKVNANAHRPQSSKDATPLVELETEDICYDTMDVWKFHEDNLSGLVDHLKSKASRQHELLIKFRSEFKNMRSMKSELRELKVENETLKKKLQEQEHIQRRNDVPHRARCDKEKRSWTCHGPGPPVPVGAFIKNEKNVKEVCTETDARNKNSPGQTAAQGPSWGNTTR